PGNNAACFSAERGLHGVHQSVTLGSMSRFYEKVNRTAAAEAIRNFRCVVEECGVAFHDCASIADEPLRFADHFGFKTSAGDAARVVAVSGDKQTGARAAIAGALDANQCNQRGSITAVPQFADSSSLHHCAKAPDMNAILCLL